MKRIQAQNELIQREELPTHGIHQLLLPEGAQVLTVGYEGSTGNPGGQKLYLHHVGNPQVALEPRTFFVSGNDSPYLPTLRNHSVIYIGSAVQGARAMVHVFELNTPEKPGGGSVRNRAGSIGPGASLVQSGSVSGGVHTYGAPRQSVGLDLAMQPW